MNKIPDLEEIREEWKKETGSFGEEFSENEYKNYLKGKSRNLLQNYRTGITIDIMLKAVISMALAGILILFSSNLRVSLLAMIMLLLTLWLIVYQSLIYKSIPAGASVRESLRDSLQIKISFYRKKYIRSIYAATLTNPLLLITGFTYYFYLKYGNIRTLDTEDLLVLAFFILVSFAIPLAVQLWHYGFQIRQLEECLSELDDGSVSRQTMERQRRKATLIQIIFIIALVGGMILFFSLLFG